MPDQLLTFQKFNDPELANTIAAQLSAQGIPSEVVSEQQTFNPYFANNYFDPTIHLKLASRDFDRAHTALESYYQSQLDNMDADYYLYSFTNDELLDLIRHPDEWGHLDYALARKLLTQRGQQVTPAQETTFRQQRLAELAQPEKTHPFQIFIGYAAALFAAGFPGLILGYVFAYMKKTLPNGEQVYLYPPGERRHGKRILVISTIILILWLWLLLSKGQ